MFALKTNKWFEKEIRKQLFIGINLFTQGPRYQVLQKSFSEGDFTSFRCKSEKRVRQTASKSATVAEPSGGVSEDSDLSTGVYSCPQDGCVRVFQRVSALEKHLSVEKCSRSPEKYSLMDLAKMGYKTHLEEGVGILPSLKAPVAHQEGHLEQQRRRIDSVKSKSLTYWRNSLSVKQRAASLTARLWRGKCDAPVEQMVCDFSSPENS